MQIAAAFTRWQRRDGVSACHHLNGEGARGSPLNGVGMWQRVGAAWAESAPTLAVEAIQDAESRMHTTQVKQSNTPRSTPYQGRLYAPAMASSVAVTPVAANREMAERTVKCDLF